MKKLTTKQTEVLNTINTLTTKTFTLTDLENVSKRTVDSLVLRGLVGFENDTYINLNYVAPKKTKAVKSDPDALKLTLKESEVYTVLSKSRKKSFTRTFVEDNTEFSTSQVTGLMSALVVKGILTLRDSDYTMNKSVEVKFTKRAQSQYVPKVEGAVEPELIIAQFVSDESQKFYDEIMSQVQDKLNESGTQLTLSYTPNGIQVTL